MAKKQIATFLGPNKGLSIIGSHAYAFSGLYAVSGSFQTHLEFTTGKQYIVGTVYCNGAADVGNVARGQESIFQIKFNGVNVAQLKTSSETDDNNPTIWNKIVIPPLTTVLVTVISDAANFGETSVVFTGRVYA